MNLKPFLVMGILTFCVLIICLGYIKLTEPPPRSKIISKKPNITKIPEERPILPNLVRLVNEANAKIGNISCDDVSVKIWQNGLRFKLSGELHYEKHRNFRMNLSSIFGEELDLGSNSNKFWYWSRRDKDPGVHWANHEDYYKTRLKTPFNPVFMMRSMGVDVIDDKGAYVTETTEDYIIAYRERSASNKEVLVSIFVSKVNQRIEGMIVTDLDARPLASAEIREYKAGLPSKILYIWHEEDRALLMELKDPKVNTSIPENQWKMPDREPKLNMAEDIFQTKYEPFDSRQVYLVGVKYDEPAVIEEKSDAKATIRPAATAGYSNFVPAYRGRTVRRWRYR